MNIIITGVSRGLGLKTLNLALSKGFCVIGISRDKSEELKSIENKFPEKFIWYSMDLSKKN